MKFSGIEVTVGIVVSCIIGVVLGTLIMSARPASPELMYQLVHDSVLEATDSKEYVLNELIKECEAAEHWGDRQYRFGWVVYTIKNKVVGFKCQTPKRTAQDWRERFITEY